MKGRRATRRPARRLRQAVAALLITPLLVVSAAATEPSPLTVRAWQLPRPDDMSIPARADLAVFQAFREKHPDIAFQQNTGLSLPGPAGGAGLIMSIAGGTAPDILYVNFQRTRDFVRRGFLYPLDEYIRLDLTAEAAKAQGAFDENIMYKDEFEERILPQVREVVQCRGPDGKMHIYALPYSNLAICLIFNKPLFRKCGLDPEKDYPKTWDEFYAVAQKLTDREKGTYGCVAYTGPGASWVAYTFMVSMNTRAMKQDPATGDWRATFDDEGMAQSVDFYTKLLQGPWVNPKTGKTEYGVAYYDQEVQMKWNRGEIGMQFGYLADEMLTGSTAGGTGTMNPDDLGFAPVPKSPLGLQASELNSQMQGLFAGTRDKRVRDAAWKYIRFFNSPEARRIRARVYVENGFAGLMLPAKLKEYGFPEYGRFFPKLWEEAYHTSFQNGVPEPYGPGCQHIYTFMSRPFDLAMTEKLARIPDAETRLRRIRVIDSEAVAEANVKMIGIVPADEMRVRRLVATVLATFIFAAFVALFTYVWRLFTPKDVPAAAATSAFRKQKIAYLLLAPAVFGILVFNYVPLFRGTIMAFQEYNVMSASKFVGIDNFANVLYDGLFWLSMGRALEFTLWYLLLVFVPPIVLAVLLSEIPVGQVLFRFIFYLPAVTSGIVTLLLWKVLFDPSDAGAANRVLALFSVGPQGWLQDKSLAMVSMMIPMTWASMGPGCLIYLAALKTVPDDLYEAAAIDGSGVLARLRHITFPTIRPLIQIQFIFALIASFQSADFVMVMTGGGPDRATHVVGLEIFLKSYVYLDFGLATAMGWILAFVLLGFTVFQMSRMSRLTFQAVEAR
jgi:multiple sugar transport system permease protein